MLCSLRTPRWPPNQKPRRAERVARTAASRSLSVRLRSDKCCIDTLVPFKELVQGHIPIDFVIRVAEYLVCSLPGSPHQVVKLLVGQVDGSHAASSRIAASTSA